MNDQDKTPNFVQTVLDSYFANRRPTDDQFGDVELKSTIEIQDDLRDILEINAPYIASYLAKHEYILTECADGRMKWKLYHNCIFKEKDDD